MPGDLEFDTLRKAYWLLSEPAEMEKLGRAFLVNIPRSWWHSRSEQLTKEEFLGTLKGSVALGDIKIWKENRVRFIRWTGASKTGVFPEAVDDARVALQLAGLWEDDARGLATTEIEDEVTLLERR